ncbi:hypothetical protein TNCV_4250351 [Trichonephila clavipes]|nr:hypothetical protein TNCV_4250351 [Trichonephila clavipes]
MMNILGTQGVSDYRPKYYLKLGCDPGRPMVKYSCYDGVVNLNREAVRRVENEELHMMTIEVSSRPKLTGIVRRKAFYIFCSDVQYVAQTHANIPDNARCDEYDREQHRPDYFSNNICTLRNGC